MLMGVLLGFRRLGVGKPFEGSGWATFCAHAGAPLIVIGAIGTLVALYLGRRRVHRYSDVPNIVG